MNATYVPINCEFHDLLEATATRRRVATFRHLDEGGSEQVVAARILDLFAKDGMEYMQLDDGQTLRLDRIVSIDDAVRDAWDVSCALSG